MTARGPFTLFGFLLPLLRLRLLLRLLLLPRRRLPPLGTAGLDTPAATFWLSRSTDVPCTRAPAEHLCHACQLGRHVRLPFSSSSSHAAYDFDLIHCDLWISHVLNMSGYKYYLVIVDDFSYYSWTFPLHTKSETFPTLLHFFCLGVHSVRPHR